MYNNLVSEFARKRPLVAFATLWGIGLLMGIFLLFERLSLWYIVVAVALFLSISILLKRPKLLLVFGLIAGILWGMLAMQRPALPAEGEAIIAGTISAEPVQTSNRVSVVLDRVSLNGEKQKKKIQLYLSNYEGLSSPLEYGQRIQVGGRVWHPKGQTNPYGFNFSAYLWQRNGVIACVNGGLKDVQILAPAGWSFKRLSIQASEQIGRRIKKLFPHRYELVSGLILGDKSEVDQNTTRAYQDSGLAHLLAVSGLHIGYLAWLIDWTLSKLGLPNKLSFILLCVLLSAYVFLVGMPASAVRAALMFLLIRASRLNGRPADGLTGLAAAFVALSVLNPLYIVQAGFILSFSAMGGIILLSPPLKDLLNKIWPDPEKSRRPAKVLWINLKNASRTLVKSSLVVSVAAGLGTLPAQIAFFNRFSTWSVLSNLLAVPVMGVLVPAAVLVLICGYAKLPFVGIAAQIIDFLLGMVTGFASWIAGLPGAVLRLPAWPVWVCVLYVLLLLAASWHLGFKKPYRLVSLAGLPLIALLVFFVPKWLPKEAFQITFLDVGQGNASLIQTQGFTYYVDLGTEGSGASSVARSMALPVDGVFLTHPHADHCGGFAELAQNMPVKTLYLPECWDRTPDTEEQRSIVEKAISRGTQIKHLSAGDVIRLSETATATVLHPQKGFNPPDANSSSLVLLIDSGRGKMLLTGDLPGSLDTALSGADADVLLVPHHGGAGSTTDGLLSAVSPRLSVLSVGYNSYGHPKSQVMSRLSKAGSALMRTDQCGAVIVKPGVDGELQAAAWLQEGG